jgi:hypothetical protein
MEMSVEPEFETTSLTLPDMSKVSSGQSMDCKQVVISRGGLRSGSEMVAEELAANSRHKDCLIGNIMTTVVRFSGLT